MNNQVKFFLFILFATGINLSFAQTGQDTGKKAQPEDKFTEIMGLVRNYYTDTVNEEKITEDAIQKALEDLDPHSSYVPAKDVKRSEEPLVGNFDGIGITFQVLKDTIMVLEVIPSGPSEKVGLLAGDKIIKVDDSIVAGIKIGNEGVIKKLRGPKGTKVTVSIMRHSERNLIDFTITRDKIPIYSLTASYIAQPGVGYVRIERFAATTMQEFATAVDKLRSQGMKDLILDLQGNVGGYLYTAIDLCNQFLGDNELIVYTQGVHSPYYPYYSNNHGMFKEGKVVVMIDEGSASAAEILSGCLQDNDRALLVGRRTFGKGLVQKPFTLSDGSEVKLTTAHYFTPSHRCIQKSYASGNKEYREDYKERLESGELFGTDTFKYADTVKYHTLNGRVEHGGGGIMPDYFVPYDTSMNSTLFNQLVRKGIENKFCLDYVDKNRQALTAAYPTGDNFYTNFVVDNNILAQYWAAAVVDSAIKLLPGTNPKAFDDYFPAVKNDSASNFAKDYAKSEILIKARLKATIGRNLFDVGMFYRVINSTLNNVYAEALKAISSPEKFDVLLPRAPATDDSGKKGKLKKKIKVVTTDETK
jgi:carboxyl-terminal processing protease